MKHRPFHFTCLNLGIHRGKFVNFIQLIIQPPANPSKSTEVVAVVKTHSTSAPEAMFTHPTSQIPQHPNETPARRNASLKGQPLVTHYHSAINSVQDLFLKNAEKYPNNSFLGTRPINADGVALPYQWQTYGQIKEAVFKTCLGMESLPNWDRAAICGIYGINRTEWIISDLTCTLLGAISVPLYDTLGEEAMRFICNLTEMRYLFLSREKIPNILRLKEHLNFLKMLICFDDSVDDSVISQVTDAGLEFYTMSQIRDRVSASGKVWVPRSIDPSDVWTICFTSGTSGMPKGVVLKHQNFVTAISAVFKMTQGDPLITISEGETHLSYLPLAHIMERVIMGVVCSLGGKIGFYQGNILRMLDDLATLKPTLFITVPRVLNRFYEKVLTKVREGSSLKKFIFNFAYGYKKSSLEESGSLKNALFDPLVFKKIREQLGGRVHCVLTGSAPISEEVLQFFRVCLSCPVYEGYGQTETCGTSLITMIGDWTPGFLTAPFIGCEIKLVDVPEMEYFSSDQPNPRGEICIRGGNCFSGYYKDAANTAEVLDSDGWVHTGDIGSFDPQGRTKIIDRKKNIFKLAQGEYIAPEKIENILTKSELVSQIYVHGDSLQSYLVAVIVPDEAALKKALLGGGCTDANNFSLQQCCEHPDTEKILLRAIGGDPAYPKLRSRELQGFEVPRAVYVESTPFSIENGLLTDTLKVKRFACRKKYAEALQNVYESTGHLQSQ